MKITTRNITVLAASLALMFVLTPIPFISLFLVPLLFIGCTQKWHIAAMGGLMFGLVSLMYAFVGPGAGTPVAIVFTQNPWMPIVPRIAVGLITAFSFMGFKKLIRGKGKVARLLPYSLAAAAGTLSNTAIILPLLVVLGENFRIAALGQTFIFASIELAVAILIAGPLSHTVAKALKIGSYAPVVVTDFSIEEEAHAVQERVVVGAEQAYGDSATTLDKTQNNTPEDTVEEKDHDFNI